MVNHRSIKIYIILRWGSKCKQNEATCSKRHNPEYKHSYTKH